ncbi:TetR/AcrR family transcriptional regulator [Paenibacillus cymbidii]|uniref:TetR/AcrR family transcriptional regulator n=1 Tax=Paenibacillus cymbidii TaxID=1639034 RepID=UPI0010818F06|nr:TetR/AcrR family transcriptional regulator [Paenibacillus cymbidii]
MYHISDDKRSRESSAWIYEALVRLMETTTYADIKITAICQEAKIGRVTFYRHYDTIDDVLRKKCDEAFDGLIEFLFDYKKNAPDEPTFFLKPFLRYWYQNPTILKQLFQAGKANILGESFDTMLRKLRATISLRHPATKYSPYFFALRTTIPIAILAEWVKNGMDIPPDELSETLLHQLKEVVKFNQMG